MNKDCLRFKDEESSLVYTFGHVAFKTEVSFIIDFNLQCLKG